MNDRKTALLIFIVALLLFAASMPSREFIGLDCRFSLFVRDILSNGVHGIFPYLYGEAYPDYTVVHAVLAALCAKVLGFSYLSLAIPGAVAAALAVSFTYLCGARISRETGLIAVFIELFSFGFVSNGRNLSVDFFVAAIVMIMFYFLMKYKDSLLISLLTVFIAVFAAVIFRTSLGALIVPAVAFVFYASVLQWKRSLLILIVSGCSVLTALGSIFFAAWLEGGADFLYRLFDAQISGRMSSSKPFFFYFVSGLAEYSLASLLFLGLLIANGKRFFGKIREENEDLRRFVMWVLLIITGLSIPGTKHLRYIIPLVPAMALAAAIMVQRDERLANLLRHWTLKAVLILPWLGLSAVIVTSMIVPFIYSSQNFVIAGMGFAALALAWRAQERALTVRVGLASLVAFWAVVIFICEPAEAYLAGSRNFVEKAMASMKSEAMSEIIFFKTGPDGDDVKFLANTEGLAIKQPVFTGDPKTLFEHSGKALVIIRKNELPSIEGAGLDITVLHEGEIGHKKYAAVKAAASK